MIGHLRGKLQRKETDRLVIDVGGVGYRVSVPLSTFYELPDAGTEVGLRIHTHVRDDAIELYGFRTATEEALFHALVSVTGIGPRLAITILSGMESDALLSALADQDLARLTSIPGIGKKTAERMALELRDKVMTIGAKRGESGSRGAREDVLSALLNLGYKPRDAEVAMQRIDDPATDFETLLRQTLRVLAR